MYSVVLYGREAAMVPVFVVMLTTDISRVQRRLMSVPLIYLQTTESYK